MKNSMSSNQKQLALLNALFASTFMLAACGGGGDTNTAAAPPTSVSPPVTPPVTTPAPPPVTTPAPPPVTTPAPPPVTTPAPPPVTTPAPPPVTTPAPAPKTWKAAAIIDTQALSAELPSFAFDAAGNGFAVWRQATAAPDNNNYIIVARRYTKAQGWGDVTQIGSAQSACAGYGSVNVSPVLTVNTSGDAFVVWQDGSARCISRTFGSRLLVKRYTAATGWATTTAATIIAAPLEDANTEPKISLSDNGTALLVWKADARSGTAGAPIQNVKMSVFAPATGWSTPVIAPAWPFTAGFEKLEMDAQGNAVSIWTQASPTGGRAVNSSQYTASGGWGAPVQIVAGSVVPSLFVMADGSAKVVWAKTDRTVSQNQLQSVSYSPVTGWSAAITAVTTNVVFPTSPAPADYPSLGTFTLDASGNVAVLSNLQTSPILNLWALQYNAAQSGWQPSTQLKTANPDGRSGRAVVRFDSSGNAIAVWQEFDGAVNNVWAARLD